MLENTTVVNFLFVAAIGLLVIVSGGIVYLTAVEWRDRRRQKRDERSARRR
jgi:hypothetical protein